MSMGKNTLIDVFSITPSDSADISADVANTKQYKAVYVVTLTTGNVSVVTANGTTLNFTGLPVNAVIGPFLVKRVRATGTTATVCGGIVGNS